MRVTIIEAGELGDHTTTAARAISDELAVEPVDTRLFSLSSLTIKPCLGCSACMVRTPGQCVHRDDVAMILKELLASDRVLFLYPLARGFMASRAKDFVDRLFPLELPYIEFRDKAMTHGLRYGRYPDWGFVVDVGEGGSKDEFEIAAELNRRLARYYRSSVFLNAESPIEPKEAAHAAMRD